MLTDFVKARVCCSREEAAQIATFLSDKGFRLGMLAAKTVIMEDLITLGGLKPFEAAAMMAGAPAADEIKNAADHDHDLPVRCRQNTPEFDLSNQADEVEWLGGEPPQPEPDVYSPSQETPDPKVDGAYRPTLPSYDPASHRSPKRARSETTK